MNVIKSAPTLKVICVAFGIALFCCLGFSFKAYNDFLDIKILLNNEKLAIMNELRKSKDSLEVAIFENSGIKAELIIEKQKVNKLLNEISRADIDVASMIKYKNEVNRLKTLIASLSKEKAQLKLNCDLVKTQRDSTISVLNTTKTLKNSLVAINTNLKSTVKKAAKLTVINLKTTSFKQFNNGRLKATDKARKVNILQITFTVVGTKISKPCDKEYYVQIIDSNNNVVGERKSKKFGEKILDYSYESPVKFNNETMEVSAELALENIEKGNYFVSVFDKDELASKTTFALR